MSDGNRNLTVIYPRMTLEENKSKRRIAAYCRVSTQAEEQSHSLAAQISYYTKLIEEDSNAVLVDIYSDRGTSGTRTRNRTNFLRLIEDCRAGKVDAIITKSVSRFGRNTVDTLVFTRELRSLGIDVYFEKENLHTCSAEGELLLTLMAAVAESESVSMSDNVKWGKRKRYEKGIVESLVVGTMLGFQQQDGEIFVIEEEATIVRMIYDWFLEGHGYEYITNRLIADNVPTKRPGAKWANTTIKNILTNEKYCGDCLFQKTFISDPIQHTSSRNRGQLPQYYIEDVLPAIIPREEWQAVQELRKRHTGSGLKQSEEYPFTNMLVCPYCGKKYGGYTSAGHNRELLNWYRCKSRHDHSSVEIPEMIYTPPSRHRVDDPSPAMVAYREKYNHPMPPRQMICSDIRIPFKHPHKVFIRAWNQLVSKKTRYQPILQRTIETTDNALTRLRAKEMIGLLDTVGRLAGFDYALMLRTLDFIEVHSEEKMTVVFQSGIRISVK